MTVTTHTDISATLAERGNRYGSFTDHAAICQGLMISMRSAHSGRGWDNLADDQRQALTVIADKIARMLNGDPTYRDNWHDIVGYAKLVDDRMARDEAATAPAPEVVARREIVGKPLRGGKAVELKPEDFELLLREAGRIK